MKPIACAAPLCMLAALAALCGGCKSAEQNAAPPPAVQTAPGATPPQTMSPEAAKAADEAAHREKRGY